jgi:CheY-like chemotaxis protein
MGGRINLRCPLAPAELVTPGRSDVTPVLSAGADDARRRVLLAQGNPVNQLVARSLLTRLGCDVDVAANGQEAIRLFAASGYDLVLMDCMMQGLDGYEATAEIRRIEPAGAGRRSWPRLPMSCRATGSDAWPRA